MTATIRAALAVYDDDALEALANRGLLRRAVKDIETGKVEIAEESNTIISINADGERVEIGRDGPRAARCTCPAASVCRHKLAAVLLLRDSTSATSDGSSAGQFASSTLNPIIEVLAIDAETLTKWSGRANMRAALELICENSPSIEHDGPALRVRFGVAWPAVLILAGQISGPQGLDSIVSKVAPTRLRALHTAAVLAVWRDQGRDITGLVEEPAEKAATALPDREFLASVKSTLEAALATAISQAPEVLEEQLFLLSVSSRADNLPALSRRLRQLSGSIRARRNRDFSVQPSEMLSAMAAAYALADALSIVGDPMAAAPLRGAARQNYVPAGSLSLVGLAAKLWETRGGARGVTGYFYAFALKRVLTVGLARVGEHDRLFDAVTAFHHESLWRTEPLCELIGRRLDLQNARVSQEERLSLAQETAGWKTTWSFDSGEVRSWPISFDDWQALQELMRNHFALKLSGRRHGQALVALLPSAQRPPRFDAVRQRTIWPLQDRLGRWLALQVPHSALYSGMAERLEALAAVSQLETVIAEIVPEGDKFTILPLTLLRRAAADGLQEHFLIDPRLTKADSFSNETAISDPSNDPEISIPLQVASARGLLLREIQDVLQGMAELGFSATVVDPERIFSSFSQRARDIGFSTLAEACAAVAHADAKSAARTALRLYHLSDRGLSIDRQLPLL